MKSKAGLVILAIPQEISPIPEIAQDTMLGFAKRAEESLNNAGVDVIRVKEFINNPKIAVETVDYLNRENIDCLIIKIGAWPSPSIAIDMINRLRRQTPVILWASSDQVTLSLVPACQFHGAFDDMSIEHEFIFAEPEEKKFTDLIKKVSSAARVVNHLYGMNLGLFGGRYMNMYTGTVDPIQVKKVFGVEITHINESVLVDEALRFDNRIVKDFSAILNKKYKKITAPEEVVNKSIRLYFAMKKLREEYNLDFATVKCMLETQGSYCSHCLSVSQSLDNGFVVSCEADINAALTMQILHLLSEKAPGFGDVFNINMEENILRIANCGAFATEFAKDPKEVVLNEQYEHLVPGPGTGLVTSYICKPGKVTLARLGRIDGKYVMQISDGEALNATKKDLTKGWERMPHIFIKKHSDPESFLMNTRSNHIHWVYGNYVEELKSICKILKIRDIYC